MQRFRNRRYLRLELDKQYKLFDTESCTVTNPQNYFDDIKWLIDDYFIVEVYGKTRLYNPVKKIEKVIDFVFTGMIDKNTFKVRRGDQDLIFDLKSLKFVE